MQETLPYAVGVAISPVAIATTLLLLTSRGAMANGISFLMGWALGVAVPMLERGLHAGGVGVAHCADGMRERPPTQPSTSRRASRRRTGWI